MPKLVQAKDNNGNIFYNSVIKTVRNISILAGQSLTDSIITKAKHIIIYYSINGNQYLKSVTIPKAETEWFWDLNSGDGFVIYLRIDWITGIIVVSAYSTVNANVKIKGYDLVI